MTDEDDADTTPRNMWDQSAPQNCQSISLFAGSANIQAVEPMLDAAAVTSGTRMLDIGTGLHAIAVAAALNRGAKPTGTDIGARIVDLAREEYPEVRFETADAAALPFADDSFDSVLCGFSIFAFEEPDNAFAEACRVLAPGGKFALTTWDWPIAGFDVFHDAMARHVPDEPILPGNRPLMNVSDGDVLIDAIRRAGFVETAIKPLPLIWELESSDQLFDALASLRDFSSLDEQTLQSFRSEVAKASEQYKRGNRYAYPFPALLLSGSKARR